MCPHTNIYPYELSVCVYICPPTMRANKLSLCGEAEATVTAASKNMLLVFPKGSVPFPLPPAEGAPAAPPPELPVPSVIAIDLFKEKSDNYCVQK